MIRFSARTDGKSHIDANSVGPAKFFYRAQPGDLLMTGKHMDEKVNKGSEETESQEPYRTLVEMSPDPIVIAQDGLAKLFNNAFKKIFRPTKEEEERGLPLTTFVQDKDKALARQKYEDRMAGKNIPINMEIDLLTRDGRIIPFETAATIIPYNGRPADMVTLRDISKRRAAEKALKTAHDDLEDRVAKRTAELEQINEKLSHEIEKHRLSENARKETEKRYRLLVETTSDWVWEVNTEGVYTYVNHKVKDILGYDIDEIMGIRFFDLLTDQERNRVMAFFKKKFEEATPFVGFETTLVHKNGHLMIFEVNGAPVFDRQGKISRWQGFNRDITEKLRVETAIRESEEKYRNLVELSPDPVVIGQGNSLQFFNSAFTKLLGYTADEIKSGLTLLDFVWEGDKKTTMQKYNDHMSGKKRPKPFRVDLVAKNGGVLSCEIASALIQFQGEPALLATIRDITKQKQNEKLLTEREQRLALAMDASKDGLWDWDIVQDQLYASARCTEITGFDIKNDNSVWTSRLHPDDKPRVVQQLKNHLKDGDPFDVEYRYRHEGGNYIWLSAYGIALRNEDGKAYRMLGSLRDITNRKHAEEELRESEMRLRQLTEATWEAIIIHERGVLLHANRQFYDMFGYDPEKLPGTYSIDNAFTPESLAYVMKRIDSNLLGSYEATGVKSDGTEFPVEIHAKKIDFYGRLVRVAAMRDLTGRKKADAALRDSEARYRLLFENASTVIQVFDQNGICLMMNEMAATYYEGVPEDFIGKSFRELGLVDADKYLERNQEIIASAKGLTFEEMVTLPSGNTVWFLSNTTPVRDSNGQVYAVQIISQDITEKKFADEQIHILSHQLIEAQENERQRISRELHDRVAQDLSSARIACRLLVGDQMVPDDARQRISDVSETLQKTIGSVRDLSYFLRPPGLEKLGLVHAISQHCRNYSGESGVEVDFTAAGMDNLTLSFDKAINLYRIIQEALNNIWKHADAEKAVVRLVASHPNILLRIEDNGIGFDAQNRMVTALGEKRMGLSSMQERVSLLKGKIEIQSRPNKGTKIFIEVPFDEKNPKENDGHPDH